jgi:deoxyribose-phosphate aldolase
MNEQVRKIVEELTREESNIIKPTVTDTNNWDEFDNSAPDLLYCEEDNKGNSTCTIKIPNSVDMLMKVGADRISAECGAGKICANVGGLIDHTALKADTTADQVVELCLEAKKYSFASVCINPYFVPLAYSILRGSSVKVCTVVGFPLGATTAKAKAFEAKDAYQNGAREIDMVINVSALKSGKLYEVEEDIKAVRNAVPNATLKVIIETCFLTDEEKITACRLSKSAGADYVKTSTGFGTGGATANDISLMRKTVGKELGVKASGGIRDLNTALEMVKAGATRIGASASVAIVQNKTSNSSY